MSWDTEEISLDDQSRFETLNGLWTGKKPPFVTVGVIRNTNFTESGRVDYSDVAWLQVEQKQLAKRQLRSGDIIVERSGGGPKQPVGRVVYFSREDGPFSWPRSMVVAITTVTAGNESALSPALASKTSVTAIAARFLVMLLRSHWRKALLYPQLR